MRVVWRKLLAYSFAIDYKQQLNGSKTDMLFRIVSQEVSGLSI